MSIAQILVTLFFAFTFVFSCVNLARRKFVHAYFFYLLSLPIIIKIPFIFTIVDSLEFDFRIIEGIPVHSFFQVCFLYVLIKSKDNSRFYFFVRQKKLTVFAVLGALSLSIIQFQRGDFGIGALLLGWTEVMDPYIFMLISGLVYEESGNNLDRILAYFNLSLLYAVVFNLIMGLLFQDVGGDIRLSGGSLGNATLGGSIFASFVLLNIMPRFVLLSRAGLINLVFGGVWFVCLLLTKTRGSMIGLMVALVFLFIKFKRISKLKLMGVGVPVILLLIPFVINVYASRNNSLSDSSAIDRVVRIYSAIDYLSSNPFRGIGWGNPKRGLLEGDPRYEMHFHIYNTFIAWLSYGGALLLLFLLNLFYQSMKKLQIYSSDGIILSSVILLWLVDFNTTGNMLLFSGYPFSAIIYFFGIIGIRLSLIKNV